MILNDIDKFINNKYMDAFVEYINTKHKLLNFDAYLCDRHVFTM